MLEQFHLQLTGKRIFSSMLQTPLVVVLISFLLTFFFGFQLPGLSFKTSIYDLVIDDLPETDALRRFHALFGSDEMIRLVVKADNVFDPVIFKKIAALSKQAAAISGVKKVISLPEIKQSVDFSGDWPMEKFETVISHAQLFRKNLISEDHKTTAMTLLLSGGEDHSHVIGELNRMIQKEKGKESLYQIGIPLVSEALADFTQKDFFRLPPLVMLVIACVLLIVFRQFQGVVLPLISVLTALVWTFGLMAMAGIALSMLTMIVPVFLIAVGTAYCLHIIYEYLRASNKAESKVDAVFQTYALITLPTFLVVITTVIGLCSLLINPIPVIRDFAVSACLGMACLFIIVMTLMPALMVMLPVPKPTNKANSGLSQFPEKLIHWIIALNLRHYKKAVAACCMTAAACAIGTIFIRVETNPVGYFKADAPVIRHFHDIYRDLSGSFPIHLTMSGGKADFFEDPAHIADLAECQTFLDALAGVDKTVSFADYLKLVRYVVNQFDPAAYSLPQEKWEVRHLLNNFKALIGMDMLARFMTKDLSTTNILLLTHISSSADFLNTRDAILSHVTSVFSRDLHWEVTGLGMAISASSHLLTSGQVKSLAIAALLVFAIMFVLFLSSKVGCIAIAANLFPIVILFGTMGWLDIEFSMATGLIASIAIGLAVDDTIHYIVRYNREFRKDLNDERALRTTLAHVGRPILCTTLTISISFSILMISSFTPTAVFGMMMVVTMIAALVGDIILLPSLMRFVELVTLWDLIQLKLGKEPRLGIPMFRGMTRTEVHYICMAGTIRQIKAGQVLFQKGERSDSIYALLSGKMEVLDHAVQGASGPVSGDRKHLITLQAGDVVGEMGLLRATARSATVVASTPAELLQINLKMIKRLQWLYPPTAHKFFFNLMGILCDRLENASHCLLENSLVDDFTGLSNKKSFLMQLDKEVSRCHRYATALSVCLIDVKHATEESEDYFGLTAPKITALSDIFLKSIRKCDTLSRLDANTFALILHDTNGEKAEILIDRLKDIVEKNYYPEWGNWAQIRFGLASMNQGSITVDSGEAFFRLAANAL